jgi:tRNA/tmRNA/rRNA uracil-C5-methylase (TrmA/RlmC/RlmD family)
MLAFDMISKDAIIECVAEKCVYGGDALARVKGPGGEFVVFIKNAFPGEKVLAKIVSVHKRFARAVAVDVMEKSGCRRQQRCPGMEDCGIVYGEIDYAYEVELKKAQLQEFLDGISGKTGLDVPSVNVFAAPSPLNYRNKITLFRDGRSIGFRKEFSHEVKDASSCPLAAEPINEAFPQIKKEMLAANARMATVRWTEHDGVKWWFDKSHPRFNLTETTCETSFSVPACGFYQVNPAMGESLAKAVREAYLQTPEKSKLVELYCGVGVFGILCAKTRPPASLVGCETFLPSIGAAKANAASAGVKARYFCESAEQCLRKGPNIAGGVVIADPPRSGMGAGVCSRLLESQAGTLLLVSCDCATLARDIEMLAPRYNLVSASLFDLFPGTACFETFAVMRRKEAC